MNPVLRQAYLLELKMAQATNDLSSVKSAWKHLERAHILSQSFAISHVYVHWKMFVLALRTKDFPELMGQIPRLLLAGPGSLFNRAPKGNTGRSNVGIFTPMKIPVDLERVLDTSRS